jgi:hypothetical protein
VPRVLEATPSGPRRRSASETLAYVVRLRGLDAPTPSKVVNLSITYCRFGG